MGWRRITNRLSEEAHKLQMELKEETIVQYLNDMLPELNLRLLLDVGDGENGEIMWVESITLTSYMPCKFSYAQYQRSGRIFNRLMGKWIKNVLCP